MNNAILSILRSILVQLQHLIFFSLAFSLSPAIKFRPVCIFSLPKPSIFSSEHSSTGRDCRCPISIQRERENAENKVIFLYLLGNVTIVISVISLLLLLRKKHTLILS